MYETMLKEFVFTVLWDKGHFLIVVYEFKSCCLQESPLIALCVYCLLNAFWSLALLYCLPVFQGTCDFYLVILQSAIPSLPPPSNKLL